MTFLNSGAKSIHDIYSVPIMFRQGIMNFLKILNNHFLYTGSGYTIVVIRTSHM